MTISCAQFGKSDVYVFFSTDNRLECCGCILGDRESSDDSDTFSGGGLHPVGKVVPAEFTSTWKMVEHLRLHRDAGHLVPSGLEADLWRDDAQNFPPSRRDAAALELPAGGVEHGDRRVALRGEILRTTVGSEVHGLAQTGSSDHDEMGVYIEPESWVLGPFDHRPDFIWRSSFEGARSGRGDADVTM